MTPVIRNKNTAALMVIGVLGLAACTTTPTISTKVENGVRLEQYKTYTLHAGQYDQSEAGKLSDEAGVGNVITSQVPKELEQRGLKLNDQNPDLIFSYRAARRLLHAGEEKFPYQEGAVDLVAAESSGRTVWRSHLQAVIDPHDKTHRQLREAIQKAFQDYPYVLHNSVGSD